MSIADDHLAVVRTVAEYCRRCDDGRFDEFGRLFAPDAQLVVRGEVIHGRDAIRDVIAALQTPERRGRHLVANVIVDIAGDAASVESDFVFFRSNTAGTLDAVNTGRYLDDLERVGGDRRLTRRAILLVAAAVPDAGHR